MIQNNKKSKGKKKKKKISTHRNMHIQVTSLGALIFEELKMSKV